MKTMKFFTAVIAAAVIFTAAASAETINTIKQVEETALLNNLDYKSAVLDVMKAENALEYILKLDSSSLDLSGSYSHKDISIDGSTGTLDWNASATLPVFDQLSLGASVNQDLETVFSLNLNPLSHSSSAEQSRLDYNVKIAAAESKAEEITDNAVQCYLDWASAVSDYEVKQKTAEVKKILYDDEKVRFEKGEAVLDDVRDAFTSWSNSRTDANDALNSLQTAETELYATLNINPADLNIELPVEADLSLLIDELESRIDNGSLSILGSNSVYQAQTEAELLKLKLDSTWIFDPQLGIGGSLAISPYDLQPDISVTASISFGLDDWNADEREELKNELEISLQQAVQTSNTEQLNLNQAVTSAKTAAINYEMAEVEFEQAGELLDEAAFLHELGEYSEAELEEASLEYEQSKNSLFSAAAKHYTALRALYRFAV